MWRGRVGAASGLAGLVLLGATGCPGAPETKGDIGRGEGGLELRLNESRMRDALFDFVEASRAEIETNAQLIDESVGADREIRRKTLLWRSRMIPLTRRALFHDDPRQGLLDLGALVYQHEDYLERGEGSELFGPRQPIAVSAAYGLRYRFEALVEKLVREKFVGPLREDLAEFADAHPIRGRFSVDVPLPSAEPTASLDQTLRDYLLAPFSAFGGLDSAADAISELASSADEIGQIARAMPDEIRWNTQLTMLELEEYETTRTARETMRTVNEQSKELTRILDAYPGRMRTELKGALTDVEQSTERLGETVKEARAAVADAKATVADARKLNDELGPTLKDAEKLTGESKQLATEATKAAEAWTETTKEITAFVKLFGAGEEDEAGDEEDENKAEKVIFGIRDAAVELRGTAQDLRAIVENEKLDEGELEARIDARIDKAGAAADALVDKATWRAVMVVVLGFGLAVAWAWIAGRMKKGGAGGGGGSA